MYNQRQDFQEECDSILAYYPEIQDTWYRRTINRTSGYRGEPQWREVLRTIYSRKKDFSFSRSAIQRDCALSSEECAECLNWLLDKKVIAESETTASAGGKYVITCSFTAIRKMRKDNSLQDARQRILENLEKRFLVSWEELFLDLMPKGITRNEFDQITDYLISEKCIAVSDREKGKYYLLLSPKKTRELIDSATKYFNFLCFKLNKFPEFVEAKRAYLQEQACAPRVKQEVPLEIELVQHWVKTFYEDRGVSLPNEFLTNVKNCMMYADTDGVNFFDMATANSWVAIFSALSYHLSIFDGEDKSFKSFWFKFEALYKELSNRIYEPIYVRWLSEICAAYTIYSRGTHLDFERMLSILKTSLKATQEYESYGRSQYTEDGSNELRRQRDAIIQTVDEAKKNATDVTETLNLFVRDHPQSFVYEVGKIRGNAEFWNILSEYDCFKNGLAAFVEGRKSKKSRGRTPIDCSDEINYVIHLVESMHKQKGIDFSASQKSTLKTCLTNATEKGGYFFDMDKSVQWINVFSALSFHLDIFDCGSENDFEKFFQKYIKLHAKLNTGKTLAFYPRNVREVIAMYSVYYQETALEFDQHWKMSKKVLDETRQNMPSISPERTAAMTERVMQIMGNGLGASSAKKSKEEVFDEINEYVKGTPLSFTAGGKKGERYRRFYCAIRDMLAYVKCACPQESFDREDLMNTFLCPDVEYQDKDERIRELEAWLFLELFENSDWDMALMCLVGKNVVLNSECTEIVWDETVREGSRTVEEVVDSVARLLRFAVMAVYIFHCRDDYYCGKTSVTGMVAYINQLMEQYGLMEIPTQSGDYNNEFSVPDLCVLRHLETGYPD